MRLAVFLLLACLASQASADKISICYNYDCAAQATVTLSGKQLSKARLLFRRLPNAKAERMAIAKAIGLLETFAGQQTPTRNDRGGNANDDELDGRMDCIDHSRNTTAYLRLLAERGWLRFHQVLEPVRRAPLLVNDHWAARVRETRTGQEFAVDSWFFDNGQPASVFELDDWMNGAEPK